MTTCTATNSTLLFLPNSHVNLGVCLLCFAQLTYLHEVAILNKKEDDMSSKTGTVKHGAPSNASSSIYSYSISCKLSIIPHIKFLLDVDRFLNDLRNAPLWQYDGYEYFSKAKKLYQQKSDIFLCHAK